MKEDECKDCGSALVFVGTLMSGKMVCRHCEQVEKQPVNLHNPGKSNLYNVGNRIGDLTGTPGDQAYGLNCHHGPDIYCPQCVKVGHGAGDDQTVTWRINPYLEFYAVWSQRIRQNLEANNALLQRYMRERQDEE